MIIFWAIKVLLFAQNVVIFTGIKIIKMQELDKNFVKIALKKTKQQSITKK